MKLKSIAFHLLCVLITVRTTYNFAQITSVKKGTPTDAKYGLSVIDSKIINEKYYTFLVNPSKSINYIDIFDNSLTFIKTIEFKKPKGYYFTDAKFTGEHLLYFAYGKNKETGKNDVIAQRYDLETGALLQTKSIIKLNKIRSKNFVEIINDTLISVNAPYDDGYLVSGILNNNLNTTHSYSILLPENVSEKHECKVLHQSNGSLLAFYNSHKQNSKTCMVTSFEEETNISFKDFGKSPQFGLKNFNKDKSFLIVTNANVRINRTSANGNGYKAGTINNLNIYSVHNTRLTKIKTLELYDELTGNFTVGNNVTAKEHFFNYDKYLGNYGQYGPLERQLNEEEKTMVLTYKDCFVVNNQLRYVILENLSYSYAGSDIERNRRYSSKSIVVLDLDESLNPKYGIFYKDQQGTGIDIGLQSKFNHTNNTLDLIYAPLSFGSSKEEKNLFLSCLRVKTDSKTYKNFDSYVDFTLPLNDNDFILALNQNYPTSDGFFYYQTTLNQKQKRLVRITIK